MGLEYCMVFTINLCDPPPEYEKEAERLFELQNQARHGYYFFNRRGEKYYYS